MCSTVPMFLALSSLEPRWMISPPLKSWRKQGGSLPCVTSTCAPRWFPNSTVMRADVPRPLALEWRPCQKKHAVRSLPGPVALSSPGFCLLPTFRHTHRVSLLRISLNVLFSCETELHHVLLTHAGDGVFPADDVRVPLVQLPHAFGRDVKIIKLTNVPGVYGHRG